MLHERRLIALSPRRVVVLRALQLGDLLCAVPALRALRQALPEAEITLVGLPWAHAFVQRFARYLDRFVEFPGFPGLPERPAAVQELPRFLAAVQAERFDLAIQLHGSGGISNPLIALFGARHTCGFYVLGAYCPDAERFLPYPEGEPEQRRLLQLVQFLGAPPAGDALEFPLDGSDEQDLAGLPEARALRRAGYACVHVGAQLPSRRWPVERFAAVGDALAERGLHVVLTGVEAERGLTQSVAAAMRHPVLDLAGRTTLGALGVLLRAARLLVCNDTGVSHVAAALGTPSVVVACGSDPARWAPLDRRRHRVLSAAVACRPCSFDACPIGHPCALGVSVEAVVEHCDALLLRYPDEAGRSPASGFMRTAGSDSAAPSTELVRSRE